MPWATYPPHHHQTILPAPQVKAELVKHIFRLYVHGHLRTACAFYEAYLFSMRYIILKTDKQGIENLTEEERHFLKHGKSKPGLNKKSKRLNSVQMTEFTFNMIAKFYNLDAKINTKCEWSCHALTPFF